MEQTAENTTGKQLGAMFSFFSLASISDRSEDFEDGEARIIELYIEKAWVDRV
jgi:hypothetical protein